MPLPNTRNVKLVWSDFSTADSYRIERKLTSESVYTLVDTVTVSPFIDWGVDYGTYDYRMTAFDGAVELAQKVKQVTVSEQLEMPGPPDLWFDIINPTGWSLTWDKSNPDIHVLTRWHQRDWAPPDSASLPHWTASAADGPTLNIALGNDEYFGTGYPVLYFQNGLNTSLDAPSAYMTMSGAPSAFEPPCSILMSVTRSYSNNDDPRCLLQLGKLALYSSTGAGQQLGLRVDGGFVTSDLAINNSINYLVAVVARSTTDIDFYRINPGTNTWASDLGVSGGAWENHGEFTIGGSLVAPYHSNRFLTAGFAAWNEALTLLELKRAVNFMVNYNNLHYR